MASKSGKVGFKFSEPCPDCARLRALLREACEQLMITTAFTADDYPETTQYTKALAARIAAEVKETK